MQSVEVGTECVKQDAYAKHLTEVNKSRSVVASEDIFNARGILLVRKGTPLDEKAANKIIQYKLLNPLEDSIAIENTIGGTQLYEAIEATVAADPTLEHFHNSLNLHDELKELCLIYNSYPQVVQKITVLSSQLPAVFVAGVVSACVGFVLAHKLDLRKESRKVVFLAGLVQNIGMLHLDPELLVKIGGYSPEQRRAVQAHPIIGEKVLSAVPNLPKDVALAVLEHHECADGSGYPRGVWGNQLTVESQIIAFVDTLFAIYKSVLLRKGYNFKEIIPIIQWSNSAHFYEVYEASVQLMRAEHLPDKRCYKDEEIEPLIDRLLLDDQFFKERYMNKVAILDEIPINSSYRKLDTAMAIHSRIEKAVSNTGLASTEYENWLLSVKNDQLVDEYMEIERAALIHNEFRYQLNLLEINLKNALVEYPKMEEKIIKAIENWLDYRDKDTRESSAA